MQRRRRESGQTIPRDSHSTCESSVMNVDGPTAGLFPLKVFSGKIDLSLPNASDIMGAYSPDVITIPNETAPHGALALSPVVHFQWSKVRDIYQCQCFSYLIATWNVTFCPQTPAASGFFSA